MAEKRLYHSVAERIKELVRQGSYPPGSRLPGERDLAEELGVSRVTVREAQIARLERIRAELLASTDLGSPDEFALEIQAAMAAMDGATVAK